MRRMRTTEIALDATPLILSSGGLPRYVTELSLALAREFPEDTYLCFPISPSRCRNARRANLLRGRPPHSGGGAPLVAVGRSPGDPQTGAQVFHGTNFEVPYLGPTPAVLTIHDLSPWRESRRGMTTPTASGCGRRGWCGCAGRA